MAKFNPFKAAALNMQRSVSDDGIAQDINALRTHKKLNSAKKAAGEAPPEPPGPQEDQTHSGDMAHKLKGRPHSESGAPAGEGDDQAEQAGPGGSEHSGVSVPSVDRLNSRYNSKSKRTVSLKGAPTFGNKKA